MKTNDLKFVSVLENKPKLSGMNCTYKESMDGICVGDNSELLIAVRCIEGGDTEAGLSYERQIKQKWIEKKIVRPMYHHVTYTMPQW